MPYYRKRFLTREADAIERLKQALAALPGSLRLYTTDGGALTVCKVGIESHLLYDTIAADINVGSSVRLMHDTPEAAQSAENDRMPAHCP